MRKVLDVLRLAYDQDRSQREIARWLALSQARSTTTCAGSQRAGARGPCQATSTWPPLSSASSRTPSVRRSTGGRSQSGPLCIRSCGARASRSTCSGWSTRRESRTDISRRSSATTTTRGRPGDPVLRQTHAPGERSFHKITTSFSRETRAALWIGSRNHGGDRTNSKCPRHMQPLYEPEHARTSCHLSTASSPSRFDSICRSTMSWYTPRFAISAA